MVLSKKPYLPDIQAFCIRGTTNQKLVGSTNAWDNFSLCKVSSKANLTSALSFESSFCWTFQPLVCVNTSIHHNLMCTCKMLSCKSSHCFPTALKKYQTTTPRTEPCKCDEEQTDSCCWCPFKHISHILGIHISLSLEYWRRKGKHGK